MLTGIRSPLLLCLAVGLSSGCFKSAASGPPSTTPTKCTVNSDCATGDFCSNGACVSGCRTNTDCPDAGVCESNGTCEAAPQCVLDTDCMAGFICQSGTCECQTDYACWVTTSGQPVDTSLICVGGACVESMSCGSDSECTNGRYCGPAMVCTAPCQTNADCGGNSQLGVLTCNDGRCSAPCVADTTADGTGGCPDGQICTSGLCGPEECATFADCGDPTLLCTSSTHGHCVAFSLCNPTDPEVCGPAADCTTYPAGSCPPGFDCTQDVCIALTTCLVNNQCPQGDTCDLGYCRDEPTCMSQSDCSANQDCIGGVCLPHVCRGASDCDGGICTAGSCQAPSTGATVYQVLLLTPPTTLEVGETEQLLAVALDAAGNSITVGAFNWSVAPSSIASVSSSGLLTALTPGGATVTVGFTLPSGTQAMPASASFQVVAAPDAGAGRVVVVDSATGAPIAGALVRICSARADGGACVAAQNLVASAIGVVSFVPPADGGFDISASDPAVDATGAPVHDIVHLLGTVATDVLVPLPGNEAGRFAGFTGTVSFGDVLTTGNTEIGLAGSSIADLASLELEDIVGQQPWYAQLALNSSTIGIPGLPGGLGDPGGGLGGPMFDGGTISIPLTGATVLDLTSVGGIAIPIHLKDEVYALGEPGLRCGWAFAGVVDAQSVLGALTSSTQNGAIGTVLPVLGNFNHGLRVGIDEELYPQVLDQEDLDGDGVCQDTSKCATGGEYLPDYVAFPNASFEPAQPQSLQVEVTAPASPGAAAQTLLLLGAQVPGSGLLPLGLTSLSATTGTTLARMAPLYGGLEASQYAVIAIAAGAGGGGGGGIPTMTADGGFGAPTAANSAPLSVLVSRSAVLPTTVTLPAAFAPLLSGPSYDSTSRTVAPGSGFGDVAQATQLVRIALVGSQQRVFVYASAAAAENGVFVPPPPGSPSYDPAADPAVNGSMVAVTLPPGATLDTMAGLSGPTLLNLSSQLVGFTRASLQ